MPAIDKVDVVEFLSALLDGTFVEGLGLVNAEATDDLSEGKMVLEAWAEGDAGPVCSDFLIRVTKFRHYA